MNTYDFKYLTETINQLGRRFHTMFMTSLQTHLQTRQKKNVYTFIQTLYPTHSKSMNNYLINHILWPISGASLRSFTYPNANKYKDHLLISKNATILLTSPADTTFIQTHRQHLQFPSTVVIDHNHEYWTTKTFIQHPEHIFIYIRFLFNSLKETGSKVVQLIPQYTVKRRAITIGKSVSFNKCFILNI